MLNSIFNLIICFLSQKNDFIKNNFIFTSLLLKFIEITRVLKVLIFAIYFIFCLLVIIIISPLIKFYITPKESDDIFLLSKTEKLLTNTGNFIENDEKEKLLNEIIEK